MEVARWTVSLSHPTASQKFMYITDSTDQHIWFLDRKTLQTREDLWSRDITPDEGGAARHC